MMRVDDRQTRETRRSLIHTAWPDRGMIQRGEAFLYLSGESKEAFVSFPLTRASVVVVTKVDRHRLGMIDCGCPSPAASMPSEEFRPQTAHCSVGVPPGKPSGAG